MKFTIDYDTVSYVSIITCTSETIQENLQQFIEENKNRRITIWFESVIEAFKEECNNDPFSIEINGCDNYEKKLINSILHNKEYISEFKMDSLDDSIIQAKYNKIDNFIKYAQTSKHDIIKKAFKPRHEDVRYLTNNTVEIPVIATVSSGKSTLLNALIGQDFLSEDTGSSTATICNVILHDNFKVFEAKAINKNIEIAKSKTDIKAFLKNWNDKANTPEYSKLKLSVEGPPKKDFNTSNLRVNFVDTPGPNSPRYENHKDQTFNYFKDQKKLPIILYVLAPGKMDTTDDKNNIHEIRKVIETNKQDLNRIIFIYNKIDEELKNENAYKDVLVKIKKFLSENDIENPIIFPVCASYAKLAVAEKDSLDENNQDDLDYFNKKFVPNPERNKLGYPLLDDVPLNDTQKNHLRDKIANGIDLGVIYSGLASIQLYIEDYIANHHCKNKYHELHQIISDVTNDIEGKIDLQKSQLEEKTDEEKKKNEEKAKTEIEGLSSKRSAAHSKIDNVKQDKGFIDIVASDVNKTLNKFKIKANKSDNLSKAQIKRIIEEGNLTVENLKLSIKTDLIAQMNVVLDDYLKKLKTQVIENFSLEDPSIKQKSFSAELLNKINVLDITKTDSFQTVRKETRYREVTRVVESRWWLKRKFNWKVEKTVSEPFQEAKTFFNKNKFRHNFIDRNIKAINQIIDDKVKEFDKTISDYAETFKKHVDTSFDESLEYVYDSTTEEIVRTKKNKDEEIDKLEMINNELSELKITDIK